MRARLHGVLAAATRAFAFAFAILAVEACARDPLPPLGQVLVYVDTDAPVGPGDPRGPAPLFDRLRVEIFAPGERSPCAGCARELVLDAEKLGRRAFSFGFVPRPRELGWRARLTMFRSSGLSTPRRASSVELVGYLPAVGEDGVSEVTARLRVDAVGVPRGTLDAPILFDDGAPAESEVGTWPSAQIVDCVGPSRAGAACVPGGAFFMGDPRVNVERGAVGGAREHLVVLSPYHLDAREVTVADVRASSLAVLDSRGRAIDPVDDMRDALAGRCDYTTAPGPHEALPVTCVSWELARRFCQARGGDLPTEAQLEAVATARGGRLAPWGDRDPSCDEAAVGLQLARSAGGCSDADPNAIGARTLPAVAGAGSADRVDLGGVSILDVGANVAEWTRDAYADDDAPCWSGGAPLRDPSCVDPAARRSVKGADYLTLPAEYAPARRATRPDGDARIGFRCAYP
jgi:formylglycine-generating enzyme